MDQLKVEMIIKEKKIDLVTSPPLIMDLIFRVFDAAILMHVVYVINYVSYMIFWSPNHLT